MANFAELRLFGRALKNTNDSNTVDSVLIRTCASKGYVMHPDCNAERVKSFMQSLPNNVNTTFYKSFNDVMNRSRAALFIDQCMHYASTYGTHHTGKAYVPNDNPAEIVTNRDVIISEVLSPIYLPKKPEIIDANKGRNNITISILSF